MTKRVVHVTTVHGRDDPRVMHREIRTLADAGYDVSLIARGDAADSGPSHPGVSVRLLPTLPLWRRIRGLPRLLDELIAGGGDLFHLHDPELLLIAGALRSATGAPVIYDKHEYQRGRSGVKAACIRWLERLVVPSLDGLLVPDDDPVTGAPDVDDLIVSRTRVATIQNFPVIDVGATPPAARRRYESSPDRPIRMLYAGVAARERGLWFMLDVLDELERRGRRATLLVAGVCHRRREREAFERSVEARGLGKRVALRGWREFLPWPEIRRAMDEADVGLMLMDRSYRSWSNVPTKFYEYGSAGLPYVCTDYPAWTNFAATHGCGLAADPSDPVAVVDAIVNIADSPSLYGRMSAKGIAASGRFRWSRVAPVLLRFYAEVLGGA